MKRQTVIIAGGGICGLYAALLLSEHCDVTILEAGNRIGGRIWDVVEPGFGGTVKRGAEFIHGKAELTFSLLEKAGITFKVAEGKMYSVTAGAMEETEFFIEGWDELMRKMKDVKMDMTLHEFLIQYFKEDKYAVLRRQAMRYAEGYDIADPDKVSVMALYKEWGEEEESYQISKGYGALIEYLAAQCREKGVQILTGKIVKHVNWRNSHTLVTTADKNIYTANKVIVTVPLGVLQRRNEQASIEFSPTLDTHIAAAQKIGFGSVIKVAVAFKQTFWKHDTAFIFGDQLFQTWWTQLPYESNTLTGWAGGNKAKELSLFSEEELEAAALASLAEIFNIPLSEMREKVLAILVTNWQRYEQFGGAYSYPTPTTREAREILNTPANDTIYFAGEALYDGTFSGTVEAALLTAKSTSELIINGL